MTHSFISGNIDLQSPIDAQGNVHIGHEIVHNYYVSTDWQKLQQRLTDALENYQNFPEYPKFAQQLQTVQDEIESFKRDVIKLAQDFQKISLHTKRLKQAKAYFDQGDYEKARGVLDTEALGKEQDVLLAEKNALEAKLEANADEFLLLARLTAMNFDLGEERIPKACEAFESALKSERRSRGLLEYADFLFDEHQFDTAELLYREALEFCQRHILVQSEIYEELDSAIILNRLANLISNFSNRRDEAETLYKKALSICEKHTSKQQNIMQDVLFEILNNLAIFLSQDIKCRKETEQYFQRTLTIKMQALGKNKNFEHPMKIITTLNNLAAFISDDMHRYEESKNYYTEALILCKKYVLHYPNIYEPYLADTLNNLAILVEQNINYQQEVERYLQNALEIRRKYAKIYPSRYDKPLLEVLLNLAHFLSLHQRKVEAELYFKEIIEIQRKYVKLNQDAHEAELAGGLDSLGILLIDYPERQAECEAYFKEALVIYQKLSAHAPNLYTLEIARVQHNYSIFLEKNERYQEAEKFTRTNLSFQRKLVELEPTIHEVSLANTLDILAILLMNNTKTHREAIQISREALALYRKLAKENQDLYQTSLARSIKNLATALSTKGKYLESEILYKESLSIYQKLSKKMPLLVQDDLAKTLFGFGTMYILWEKPRKALPLLKESLKLYKSLYKLNPDIYAEMYELVQSILSEC